MIIEALVADRGRDDAGVNAVHRRADGRCGRDIVLSPVTHNVFPDTNSYGKGSQTVQQDLRGGCSDQLEQVDIEFTATGEQKQKIGHIQRSGYIYVSCSHQVGPQAGAPIVPPSLGETQGLLCGKGSALVSTPDSGKHSSAGPIGTLQPESGVEPWGLQQASRGQGLGLAFRAEVVARPRPPSTWA